MEARRDSKRDRLELPGAGGDDPGGRPGRRISADRDGGECDPWLVFHPAGVPGQGESETAGAIRIFMEHGDDGGCPVVGDRYQYGTKPFRRTGE